MPAFWLIPAACGLVAVVCVGVGIVAVMREQRALRTHAQALSAAGPLAIMDSGRLDAALSRIADDAEIMQAELARTRAALGAIVEGTREFRLREAITALRVAAVSLRALRSLF